MEQFVSTRNNNLTATAAEAILRGIAPDGGLYVPETVPSFSIEDISAMVGKSYPAISAEVLARFLPGFSKEELAEYTKCAYASFRDEAVTPLRKLESTLWSMELFHGPTCAFKDVALQLLPYLLSASAKKTGESKLTAILVATSGDTGKAALEGFADVPGTRIGVFYPQDGVSRMQKLQMTTQMGENVLVLGVNGNFDDAQSGVKAIFTDEALKARLVERGIAFSSANSINWGRLAPQIAYYYAAYVRLCENGAIRCGEKISFCVPTGNFGDILAGYYAKKSGLPVDKLICASNSNHVLTDFLCTGIYDRNRPFFKTVSPSMDILISSNLERLLYLVSGDAERVSGWMESLRASGVYDIGEEMLDAISEEGFLSAFADEEETARTIAETWGRYHYAADPHTAVGLSAERQKRASGELDGVCVVLATASPFKFSAAMLRSLGKSIPADELASAEALSAVIGEAVPAPLADVTGREVRFTGVTDKNDMAEAVEKWLVG